MIHGSYTICRNEERRRQIRLEGTNGLDYLEVSDDQYQLTVRFLNEAPENIAKENVCIKGGRRITDIKVLRVKLCDRPDPEEDDCLIVTLDQPGDFSTYTLCLVDLDEDGRPSECPFPGLDPRYACIEFSFKEGCPSDLDCAMQTPCPPERFSEPEISYLAKDYASFRQLILDRLALIMPDWRDRNVPDLGITLVEILAYVGDYLSYYQDAVATEAYLDTARQRVSVRRHARLVDYFVHEGCNARAFVCLKTDQDLTLMPETFSFITGSDHINFPKKPVLTWDDLRQVPDDCYEVFAPLVKNANEPVSLYAAHNPIRIYTWGNQECCLAKGATSVYLIDGQALPIEVSEDIGDDPSQHALEKNPSCKPVEKWRYERGLHLNVGDFLIFEEVIGPETGCPYDADPGHRHAVRITRTEQRIDTLYHQPLLEVFWAPEDALPFPLCISTIGPAPECQIKEDVSVAYGNVLLVDHGRRVGPEALGCVPIHATQQECEAAGFPSYLRLLSGPFHPNLKQPDLTFSEPLEPTKPATRILEQNPRLALGSARLVSCADPDSVLEQVSTNERLDADRVSKIGALLKTLTGQKTSWQPVPDLLSSTSEDNHFVVEMDNHRRANVRFGDGELGRQPNAGHCFKATYRVGTGPNGHVGAEKITHIVFDQLEEGANLQSRNPMPATGGIAPETISDVKLMAPHAFRRELKRAITADDYAAIVMRDFEGRVQRAAALHRWTGSHVEATVAVDPMGTVTAPQALLDEITRALFRRHAYRFETKRSDSIGLRRKHHIL